MPANSASYATWFSSCTLRRTRFRKVTFFLDVPPKSHLASFSSFLDHWHLLKHCRHPSRGLSSCSFFPKEFCISPLLFLYLRRHHHRPLWNLVLVRTTLHDSFCLQFRHFRYQYLLLFSHCRQYDQRLVQTHYHLNSRTIQASEVVLVRHRYFLNCLVTILTRSSCFKLNIEIVKMREGMLFRYRNIWK